MAIYPQSKLGGSRTNAQMVLRFGDQYDNSGIPVMNVPKAERETFRKKVMSSTQDDEQRPNFFMHSHHHFYPGPSNQMLMVEAVLQKLGATYNVQRGGVWTHYEP